MARLEKNQLGFGNDLFVYQDKDMFNYSVDTILLGNFASINPMVKRVLEVGTNNGALALFLSERSDRIKIDALEIQKKAIDLAEKNIIMNNKQDQISLIHDDFNHY